MRYAFQLTGMSPVFFVFTFSKLSLVIYLRSLLVLGLVILANVCSYSQALNLVPNPDFEQFSACPDEISQINLAVPWQPSALRGSTDYFHGCSSGPMSTPRNYADYRPAHSGKGYAGFHCFDQYGYREYAQVQLSQPLQAGTSYYVRFFVARRGRYNLAIDNLGAYFSSTAPDKVIPSALELVPQVRNPAGQFLRDTINWMKVEGSFTAVGGEQFVTIGNLYTTEQTPYVTIPNGEPLNQNAYYYLDDVWVSDCPITTDLGPDRVLCSGKAIRLSATTAVGASYLWQDGTTDSTLLIQKPGTYWVEVQTPGCSLRDSVEIRGMETLQVLADVGLCPDRSDVLLRADFPGATGYRWSNGSRQPSLLATVGTYWVDIQLPGCSFRDSVQVLPTRQLNNQLPDKLIICDGLPHLLDARLEGATDYLWSDGYRGPTRMIQSSVRYWVTAQIDGCSYDRFIRVDYWPTLSVFAQHEKTLCEGESLLLSTEPNFFYSYRWSDGSTKPTLLIDQPGVYWVDVNYQDRCVLRDSVVVSNPLRFLLRGDTTLCQGQTRLLEAVGERLSFRWSDGSSGKFFSVRSPGSYWVEAQNTLKGCRKRQDFQITPYCSPALGIPNIITPNGDEKNQFFFIEHLTPDWALEIFNRWGNCIYQAANYNNEWDATDQDNGVYFYRLQNQQSGEHYQGWLQVLR